MWHTAGGWKDGLMTSRKGFCSDFGVLLCWTPSVSSLSRAFLELQVAVMAIWNQRFTALRAAFIRKLSTGPTVSFQAIT
jgi:hypothetical protein